MNRMLSIQQAVKEVDGLSEYALRKLINEGKLPVVRAGRKVLINEITLNKFLLGETAEEKEEPVSLLPFKEIVPVMRKI